MIAAAPRPTGPVLVLDADQASALAIVRSLGCQGVVVQVASDQVSPLASHSRHVARTLRYPDPLREESAFVDWLVQYLAQSPAALVIPVTERTLVPLMRQRHRFDDRRMAMAPTDALEQVLDKDRTLQLAQRLGVPVPRSVTVTSIDDLDAALAVIGYPVVVKPSRSVGQDAGQRVQMSVSYAHSAAELRAQVQHALRHGGVILQEYFRGDGVGVELIADHGEIRHAFQHRRLHEVPLTGGGSSLRVSEAVVPALHDAADRLMRALRWHGVAMVEFKYAAATGEFRLMEINGRFWGSLPLAVAAGADFPAMLHELMTQGAVSQRPPARQGVLCRHMAREILWLEHVLRKAAPPGLVVLPSLRDVLRDCLLVFSGRHHFDVQAWRDPLPGLVDITRILRLQWQRVHAALSYKVRLARAWRSARQTAASTRRAQAAQHVLFLCYGNINRSALAHAYAQCRHAGVGSFQSAGFHAVDKRSADPVMVDEAAARGVDLARWQSQTLQDDMVRRADAILVMELAHLERVVREHPQARGKTFLLGAPAASAMHQAEVPDPYGKPRAEYARVCNQVLASVDAWFKAGRS